MKYRKKPIVVEAVQWFKTGDHPIVCDFDDLFVSRDKRCDHCGNLDRQHGWIRTLEGGQIVCPGDWIISGITGENHACKPNIFALYYEPAE